MKNPKKNKATQLNVRVSAATEVLFRAVQQAYGISNTALIEQMIRREAVVSGVIGASSPLAKSPGIFTATAEEG